MAWGQAVCGGGGLPCNIEDNNDDDDQSSQGPYRCLQVLTNWICQVRPYKSLHLHHHPYKSSWYWKCNRVVIKASHFSKSATLEGSTHFPTFKIGPDMGWDDVWSRPCFPPCWIRSHAAKITVARLHDNFQVSRLVAKNQPFGCEDAEKMFVPKLLAKGQCIPGVGSKR